MAAFLAEIYSWISFVPNITFKNLLEIAIITVVVYEMLIWIKNTRAWILLKGILFILAFFLMAAVLELETQLCAIAVCDACETAHAGDVTVAEHAELEGGGEAALVHGGVLHHDKPHAAAGPALYVGEMLFGRGVVGVCKIRTH